MTTRLLPDRCETRKTSLKVTFLTLAPASVNSSPPARPLPSLPIFLGRPGKPAGFAETRAAHLPKRYPARSADARKEMCPWHSICLAIFRPVVQYRAEEGLKAAIGHRLLPTPRILDTVLQTED